jgi:hypothetical protein
MRAATALEDVVVEAGVRHGVDVAEATMRVKLATLTALDDPHAGHLAMTWWSLSRACHEHAYEMPPHHGEVADGSPPYASISAECQLSPSAGPEEAEVDSAESDVVAAAGTTSQAVASDSVSRPIYSREQRPDGRVRRRRCSAA